jgi:hypothetical protein
LTVPRFMHPAQRDTRTNDQTIYVFWDPLTTSEQMGGSAILSYGLQWDDNTGMASWSNLQGYTSDSILTSFSQTEVIPGAIYNMRLQARNIYGWGEYSEVFSVAASGIPAQMAKPVTSHSAMNVKIDWVAPYDNSDIIIGYRIYIRGKDSQYYQTDSCLAETPPLPLSCEVPMLTL